jgi:conjugal transfer pilus assembly protein TraV
MYTQTPKTAAAPLLGLAFCFSLCACSTTSETFDCPAGKGVGCKSIAEVNHMVNEGGLGESEVEKGKQSILPLSSPIMATDSLTVERDKTLSQQAEIPLSDTMTVHRIQEEYLRVWIAPFQDAQGNLHEGSIVHTVLKPGSWQVRVVDPSVGDTNIDDREVSNSQSSESEEYP